MNGMLRIFFEPEYLKWIALFKFRPAYSRVLQKWMGYETNDTVTEWEWGGEREKEKRDEQLQN